jgi:hypothetical protein
MAGQSHPMSSSLRVQCQFLIHIFVGESATKISKFSGVNSEDQSFDETRRCLPADVQSHLLNLE